MKRFLFFLAVAIAASCSLQAAEINASAAQKIADEFFKAQPAKLNATAGQPATRLAYRAEADRFYVFDRGAGNGFVVVAGDDRLPQVMGYSLTGTFSPEGIPLAMQDWMAEMNREIAFMQTHSGVKAYRPTKRASAVGPLLTTLWDQGSPYNDMCPTYNVGDTVERAVTGCIATATAQVMNYHEWPIQGNGSHSYNCNVNGSTPTALYADYSQSFYQWDKMLDYYDANSSAECCAAVAKLMSDVGIAVEMGYGSSSGAMETDVVYALPKYFGYSSRLYLLHRDLFSAEEWDQILVDEIDARRPIIYCGYTYSVDGASGHAFVLDGYDTDGYFRFNWGWGGHYDGYFLISALTPSSYNFKYGQDGIFGVVPAPRADEVKDVMYLKGEIHPAEISVPRTQSVEMELINVFARGNMVDTVGFDQYGWWSMPYDEIPLSLRIFDENGEEKQSCTFTHKVYIGDEWLGARPVNYDFMLDPSIEDGEYTIQVGYSLHKDGNYDSWMIDAVGGTTHCKMRVSDGIIYLSDCSLSGKYLIESMKVDNAYANTPFNVEVNLSYPSMEGPGGQNMGSKSNSSGPIRLMLKKDCQTVAVSEPVEAAIEWTCMATYNLQMTAPAEWGPYDLMVVDESGGWFVSMYDDDDDSGIQHIIVLPQSDQLTEDFETMTANTKTNDTNVEGRFTSWSFTKSGIRAPGENKCYGTNAVMMKKPSAFYSVVPVSHNIFMAEASFFNNSSTAAKYTLEYSVDNGTTWVKALTVDGLDAADVAATSIGRAMWELNLTKNDAALFRVSMVAGGSAATYADNFILYYDDDAAPAGDVNGDGEVNIGDVNAVIDVILGGGAKASADVNGDGEVNIADVNAIIDSILAAS